MSSIYCIMFTFSLNDDVRDLLFQTAYLILRGGMRKKKVRSKFCEGMVSKLGPISYCGNTGIQFEAKLETEDGDLEVLYLVRPEELGDLEKDDSKGAWLSLDEIANPPKDLKEKMRLNPIRRVAKKHLEN